MKQTNTDRNYTDTLSIANIFSSNCKALQTQNNILTSAKMLAIPQNLSIPG